MTAAGSPPTPGNGTAFEFRLPPRIIFGAAVADQVGTVAAELASRSALLVTDSTMVRHGLADRATTALGAAGLDVAVYSAVDSEPTQEHGFKVAQADGTTADVPYGIFTYSIFSALAKNPNQTYRQLAQSVLADYASQNLLRPTPMFEGKLDAPVFGSADAAAAQQWPTTAAPDGTLSISAGQLHGLAVGTKLLLLPSPSASDDQAIGLMEVTSTTELRSTVAPSSDDKHAAITAADVPKGAYVRLEQVSYPFELTVSKPDPATTDAAHCRPRVIVSFGFMRSRMMTRCAQSLTRVQKSIASSIEALCRPKRPGTVETPPS